MRRRRVKRPSTVQEAFDLDKAAIHGDWAMVQRDIERVITGDLDESIAPRAEASSWERAKNAVRSLAAAIVDLLG